jgi:hypothetical protein
MTGRRQAAGGIRRRIAGLALAAVLGLGGSDAFAAEDVDKEHQIKAAFLYNFSKYVEWPAHKFADEGSPIVIGAYCTEAFGSLLGKIVAGRTVQGRPVIARTLKSPAESAPVQMVFVCAENVALWPRIQEAIRDRFVVTVADSGEARPAEAVIAFVLEVDRIRFSIDMVAAGHAGVKVSDQLQKLAVTVKRAP